MLVDEGIHVYLDVWCTAYTTRTYTNMYTANQASSIAIILAMAGLLVVAWSAVLAHGWRTGLYGVWSLPCLVTASRLVTKAFWSWDLLCSGWNAAGQPGRCCSVGDDSRLMMKDREYNRDREWKGKSVDEWKGRKEVREWFPFLWRVPYILALTMSRRTSPPLYRRW